MAATILSVLKRLMLSLVVVGLVTLVEREKSTFGLVYFDCVFDCPERVHRCYLPTYPPEASGI